MKYNIEHIHHYGEIVSDPIQSDEALLLYSLVKVTRPKIIVEIGFSKGSSALNFLKAMPEECRLYSFEIDEGCRKYADSINDPRFKFVLKGQEAFLPSDIDDQRIDLLFIDASHELRLNKSLFKRIRPCLNENALVVIHDTGTWNRRLIPKDYEPWQYYLNWKKIIDEGAVVNEVEFAHQPGERRFVNWIKRRYPEFEVVNFHSLNTVRHGLTLLQKYKKLELGKIKLSVNIDPVKQVIRRITPAPLKKFLRLVKRRS
ncbi:MAG: hypothetical protein AMJ95_10490 [Omnitrophica WOR_2 bacterium SM23_72]|nr:MAG: hypothetical protein AMJ95_10490 [Omnitrophica WOR_2 bacterium SM23_72]